MGRCWESCTTPRTLPKIVAFEIETTTTKYKTTKRHNARMQVSAFQFRFCSSSEMKCADLRARRLDRRSMETHQGGNIICQLDCATFSDSDQFQFRAQDRWRER